MSRICQRQGCSKPLPAGSATQRKYCSGRCQRAESRRRAAEQGDQPDHR
jgi:hypothetical protein